jgi:hypothetical protein
MLYRFGKVGYGFVSVAVFDAFPDAMVQMTLQNDLPHLMQRAFYRVYLDKDVFAGDIFVNHFINPLNLTGDFIEPFMQIARIHTLTHYPTLLFGLVAGHYREHCG